MREFEILAKVNHPNIIKLYHHEIRDAKLYMAIELCTLGDLSTLIKNNSSGIPEKDVKFITQQIVNAFRYLQSLRPAIAHRDLKPG
jgi:calcium-dependent protein kinase